VGERSRGREAMRHLKYAWHNACSSARNEAAIADALTRAAVCRLRGRTYDVLTVQSLMRTTVARERRIAECDGRTRGHFFRWRELLESTTDGAR